jgi:hypothetical protein
LKSLCSADADISSIEIKSRSISDAGLSHLTRCSGLTNIKLDCPQLTDAGLEALRHTRILREVHVGSESIDGRFVDWLKGNEHLMTLERISKPS